MNSTSRDVETRGRSAPFRRLVTHSGAGLCDSWLLISLKSHPTVTRNLNGHHGVECKPESYTVKNAVSQDHEFTRGHLQRLRRALVAEKSCRRDGAPASCRSMNRVQCSVYLVHQSVNLLESLTRIRDHRVY